MSYRVSPHDTATIFHDIKEALPASEVLSRFLGPARLRRFLCPFHPDKNPSLSAYGPAIRCFGCQWAGDIFRFIEDYLNIDRGESLRILADLSGVILLGPTSRPSRIQLLHRRICRDNDRLGKEIDHEARIALADGWRRIFEERHGDQERLWGMIDAACTLERAIEMAHG